MPADSSGDYVSSTTYVPGSVQFRCGESAVDRDRQLIEIYGFVEKHIGTRTRLPVHARLNRRVPSSIWRECGYSFRQDDLQRQCRSYLAYGCR